LRKGKKEKPPCEIFELIGGDLKKLREKIAKLETAVAVLRGMKRGKIARINGTINKVRSSVA
jgi:hypothetical protein